MYVLCDWWFGKEHAEEGSVASMSSRRHGYEPHFHFLHSFGACFFARAKGAPCFATFLSLAC